MSAGFPVKTFRKVAGKKTIKGELVIESSTAYQVAVDGKVRLLLKSEWSPLMGYDDYGNFFESMFGGFA